VYLATSLYESQFSYSFFNLDAQKSVKFTCFSTAFFSDSTVVSDSLNKEIRIERNPYNFPHYFVWSLVVMKKLRMKILDKILVTKVFRHKRVEETE
jgi:hypothetical protein